MLSRATRGWKKGSDPEPERIKAKRRSFKAALDAGRDDCEWERRRRVCARRQRPKELELLVEYGLGPVDALRAATSVGAKVLHVDEAVGSVVAGKLADLIAVEGDPTTGNRGAAQGPVRDEGRGDLQEPVTDRRPRHAPRSSGDWEHARKVSAPQLVLDDVDFLQLRRPWGSVNNLKLALRGHVVQRQHHLATPHEPAHS